MSAKVAHRAELLVAYIDYQMTLSREATRVLHEEICKAFLAAFKDQVSYSPTSSSYICPFLKNLNSIETYLYFQNTHNYGACRLCVCAFVRIGVYAVRACASRGDLQGVLGRV